MITEKMLLAVFVLVLPLSIAGQGTVSYSLMDFALTSVEGNGFTTTWRVPEGSGDFSYFQMYFTFFSSNNYRRSITVYPSDDRLNMTDDWYIFQFAGLHTLNSYEDYDQDSYGRGNGSFLITVVGFDGTGYWFSDDLMFTPAKSFAPFELMVVSPSNEFSVYYGKILADELTLVVRSISPGFVRKRGAISSSTLTWFGNYSVFRGVISAWGSDATLYRDNLQWWLNANKVNDTLFSAEGSLLYLYNSISVLLSEGPCGFNISSVDDPFCGTIITTNPTMSTTASMSSSTPVVTNATSPPTAPNVDQSGVAVSSGSSAISNIALAISCIAIVISLLVAIGLALYIVLLKRQYKDKIKRELDRPLSVIGFSDTNTPGAAYTESPIYVPEDKGFVEHEITPEDDDDNFQQVEDIAY